MITKKLSLNGEWELFYYKHGSLDAAVPEDLGGAEHVTARVPGNAEISLAEAGVIPSDLFKGMATKENQKFEKYHWWYKKEFEFDGAGYDRVMLKFGAVDCYADYFLNGVKIGETENAFIPVETDVTDVIKSDSANALYVHIKPAMLFALDKQYGQRYAATRTGEQMYLRKPAHSFGWDIFPRAVSAGIWKDVEIAAYDSFNIEEFGYVIKSVNADEAEIWFHTSVGMPFYEYDKDVKVKISAVCGSSKFDSEIDMNHFKAARECVIVKKPKLWWPYGYGDSNIYDVTYELLVDGEVKDSGSMNMGIRTVELKRTETMLEKDHCFKFIINGIDVMCKGSNWVPLDAYHSRDKERYQRALELFTDTHSNILRIWGGGVYEQPEFYDYCDRHGIMVWQDFMIACVPVSTDDDTMKKIEKEAECVVKALRHHPSIILWSGDNEIDEGLALCGVTPKFNKINRELLPNVVAINDISRPYMASSPYLNDEYAEMYPGDIFPERHLWGSRDYFKADFYSKSTAHFVSETGYHGCPCLESIKKIVDEDCIWPIYNEQWSLHSSDQRGSMHRVELMAKQIEQLFAFTPDNIEDFILASQISQAEAKKYFIERIRIKKPYTSGVIWWNMLDGWPQMSDAVVDYFFEKKLAYYYIKRSQQPFALMIDEMKDWNYTLIATNDTLEPKTGKYKVFDIDDGKVLAEGEYNVDKNSNKKLGEIPLYYSDKKFLVIEWEENGAKKYNHYLCGMPGFDFETYKNWLEKYNKTIR